MTTTGVIHSGRVPGSDASWVHWRNGRIIARGSGEAWRTYVDQDVECFHAEGRWIVPGFIDIHCHGGGGYSFDDGDTAIESALEIHRASGTTRSVVSLSTAPFTHLLARLSEAADVARRNPLVLGVHLEGPFLDAEFRGAHDPAQLRGFDMASIDALLEAADTHLAQVTLAPELAGGAEAVHRFVAAGVRVAIGHSGVDYDQAIQAFDQGATILTHAFNGMRGIHHRAPGPVVAAMEDPRVTLELIADGLHVDMRIVHMTFQVAASRIALVTDAIAAAGHRDGDYTDGGMAIRVRDGVARLTENGTLAGSTITLSDALRRVVEHGRVDLDDAVRSVTEIPARAIGREHDLGRLDPGYFADIVVLDEDLMTRAVWAAGSVIAGTLPSHVGIER